MVKTFVIWTLLALGMATLGITGALHKNRKRRSHNQGQINEPKPKAKFTQVRVIAFILALLLGQFLYLRVHSAWINYWLLADGQKGVAQITGEASHNTVIYQYSVSGRDYAGRGYRNREDEKDSNAKIGDESIVYYSLSHPGISLLNKPNGVVEGLSVIILVLLIESFAVFTIIRPQSGWALNLSDKKSK